MPRLFTAIEIPETIKDELADLEAPLPGARWVDMDDFHLTIRFVGDIDNHVADEFADFLSGITGHAFDLRLAGVGQFGGHDPKLIWAGLEPSAELDTLARAHERAARNAGLPPDKRGFKPHITLARLRYADPRRVAAYLERFARFRSATFTVTRFVLLSSRPQVGGGPFVVEAAYPLTHWGDDQDLEYDPPPRSRRGD